MVLLRPKKLAEKRRENYFPVKILLTQSLFRSSMWWRRGLIVCVMDLSIISLPIPCANTLGFMQTKLGIFLKRQWIVHIKLQQNQIVNDDQQDPQHRDVFYSPITFSDNTNFYSMQEMRQIVWSNARKDIFPCWVSLSVGDDGVSIGLICISKSLTQSSPVADNLF